MGKAASARIPSGRRPRAMAHRQRKNKDCTPPFPKQQMLVLAMCRICEPIAFTSIFPYIYYMIQDFGVTTDTSRISFYAGMVTSAFTFAEFSTGMLWGRLSDKVGRKPILLMGLAGTAISALIFGFAPSLPVALFARALGGLLNGNIGVLQTTVAELVTVKEHQARAYTIMPLVWCLGSIIGPMIGGALARPCDSYPGIFARGTIFDKFPYLLPNLFSACAVFCGLVIGILFLEETHADMNRHDPGLVVGRNILSRLDSWRFWLVACFKPRPESTSPAAKKRNLDLDILEGEPLLHCDDDLPQYQSVETSSEMRDISADPVDSMEDLNWPGSTGMDEEMGRGGDIDPEKTDGKQKIFTRAIVLNIVSYGILAFHTITFDQLLPVFLSTAPTHHESEYKLPFKFDDGFGMNTKQIGIILSLQGGYSLISNYFLFPFVVGHLGPRNLFKLLALSYFLLYLVTPYLLLLPSSFHTVGIYAIIIWKCTFATLAYPSNAILLANSAPSTKTLGTINGVAASTASLCRAFGPTISGALYALGLQTGYSGLVWWCTGALSIIGAIISTKIPEPHGRLDIEQPNEEDKLADENEHVDPLISGSKNSRVSLPQGKPGCSHNP